MKYWDFKARDIFLEFFPILKIKELSDEEIERIKTQKYPKYFNYIYWLIMLGYVGISFASPLILGIPASQIQKNLLGVNAIYFSDTFYWAFVAIHMFTGLLFFGYAYFHMVHRLSSSLFWDFVNLKGLDRGWKFDYLAESSSALKPFLIYLIMSIPFAYLAFRDIKAIYSDRVIVNSFFEIKNTEYKLNQVEKLRIYAKDTENNYFDTKLILSLKDGRQVDLDPPVNLVDIAKLKRQVEAVGIFVQVDQPSYTILNELRNYSQDSQKAFYEIFGSNPSY